MKDHPEPSERRRIEAWFPFVFSKEIDPRAIVTVGDQVASEHLFAFHSRESIRDGFASVLSEVRFDDAASTMTVRPRFGLKTSGGTMIDPPAMCASFESSLRNASHSIISSLVSEVRCLPDSFKVQFQRIPVNIRYLLTLADFSVFEPRSLPVSGERIPETTGPYYPISVQERRIELRLNPEYPSELRANSIADVSLVSYSANDSGSRIDQLLEMGAGPLAYFYGYALSAGDLERLRNSRYRMRIIPSEWIVYVGLSGSMNFKDRLAIASVMDRARGELLKDRLLSQPAYSISPQDRPYGLTAGEYERLTADLAVPPGALEVTRGYRIVTLDEWSKLPIFAGILDRLKAAFPAFEVQLLPRERIGELWSSGTDIAVSPMGIAPSDPLNNFGFMTEFRHLISEEEIARASTLSDPGAFNSTLKDLEARVVRDRIWIPMSHFSSVIVEPEDLERDESLAWSWGIQTWTYRLR